MQTEKKSNVGRKKLPALEKKVRLDVYKKLKDIESLGGKVAAQKRLGNLFDKLVEKTDEL